MVVGRAVGGKKSAGIWVLEARDFLDLGEPFLWEEPEGMVPLGREFGQESTADLFTSNAASEMPADANDSGTIVSGSKRTNSFLTTA